MRSLTRNRKGRVEMAKKVTTEYFQSYSTSFPVVRESPEDNNLATSIEQAEVEDRPKKISLQEDEGSVCPIKKVVVVPEQGFPHENLMGSAMPEPGTLQDDIPTRVGVGEAPWMGAHNPTAHQASGRAMEAIQPAQSAPDTLHPPLPNFLSRESSMSVGRFVQQEQHATAPPSNAFLNTNTLLFLPEYKLQGNHNIMKRGSIQSILATTRDLNHLKSSDLSAKEFVQTGNSIGNQATKAILATSEIAGKILE
ncbi:hypothetical protein NDU88_004147 [Pleurodeles waltl]|uniref:Uncharacterized protein n=1 Tax=Pleurodeles waltl TaxID=8319 RepID=A0AAV7MU12_PLEWA|nr:hypothetical protein NDU88_004147 [Pleurodeles waltl]